MKIDMNAWNQTEAADMGGFKRLPAGGYVCRVQAVREDKSRSGNDEIVIRLDIAEGPFAGYFSRDYMHSVKRWGEQAFWKGTYTQVTVGKSIPFFKGLLEAFKASNPGYEPYFGETGEWDEQELRGKLIGFIFREETSPTTGKTSVVARYPKDVETIRSGNYTVPAPAMRQYYGPASELSPLEDEDIPF